MVALFADPTSVIQVPLSTLPGAVAVPAGAVAFAGFAVFNPTPVFTYTAQLDSITVIGC